MGLWLLIILISNFFYFLLFPMNDVLYPNNSYLLLRGSIRCRLEEGMATYSSILARRIPWAEEPGGPQSMGLQGVWHNWSDLVCTHIQTEEYHLACRKKLWHMCHTQWMNIEPIMLNEISQSRNITWSHSYKENWAPKNWCFWAVVVEKALGRSLPW